MATTESQSTVLSPLIPIGIIVLIVTAVFFVITGNMYVYGNWFADGLPTATNSEERFFIMGLGQAASAAGMALGFGLLAGGAVTTVCASIRR